MLMLMNKIFYKNMIKNIIKNFYNNKVRKIIKIIEQYIKV